MLLKRQALGERDDLLVCFGLYSGRFSAVVRGSRTAKSRVSGLLEPPVELTGLVRAGSPAGLDRVSEIRLSRAFSGLRSSLDHLLTAGFLGRLFLECLPEKAPDEELYELLGLLYERLAEGTAVRTTALVAQDRLLSTLGFELGLLGCVVCEARDVRGFSAVHGGLLCKDCVRGRGALALSEPAVSALREIRHLRLGRADLALLPEVTREIGRVYKMQLQEHLGVSGRVFRPVLPSRSTLGALDEEGPKT